MLNLHDTARGLVRPLELRDPGKVSMYVCGPTVYDLPHLGLVEHERLLAADVFAGAEGVDRHRLVQERRGRDVHGVHLGIGQQLVVIGVNLFHAAGRGREFVGGLRVDVGDGDGDGAAALGEDAGHVVGDDAGTDDAVADGLVGHGEAGVGWEVRSAPDYAQLAARH